MELGLEKHGKKDPAEEHAKNEQAPAPDTELDHAIHFAWKSEEKSQPTHSESGILAGGSSEAEAVMVATRLR